MINQLLHLAMLRESVLFGWALVHFLWQGLLISGLLEIALLFFDRGNAALRYVFCGVALALMPVCLAGTYLVLGGGSHERLLGNFPAEMTTFSLPKEGGSLDLTPLPLNPFLAGPTHNYAPPLNPNQCMPVVVILWLGGVVILAGRKAGGFLVIWRLRNRGVSIPSNKLLEQFRVVCRKLGVSPERVCLRISTLSQVPIAMGWLKPIVLFPAYLLIGLSSEEIELLLAHELAHIRRCDYLVNLFQTVVETLFFYHPSTWWISRRMRQERENACDDLIAAQPADVLAYAKVLARLETMRPGGSWLAAAANGGSLLQRVQRLLGGKPPSGENYRKSLVPIVVTVLILGCLAVPLAGQLAGPETTPINKEVTTNVYLPEKASAEYGFSVALPFNDLAYPDLAKKWVPKSWVKPTRPDGKPVSSCLGHWLKITNLAGDVCYAQWQDVRPGLEDEAEYLFGNKAPKSAQAAGLDVSYDVAAFLGIDGKGLKRDVLASQNGAVSWQFVDESEVPAGPWRWEENYATALAKAKAEQRPIFLMATMWQDNGNGILTDVTNSGALKDFIWVKSYYKDQDADALQKKYQISGWPAYVFIDSRSEKSVVNGRGGNQYVVFGDVLKARKALGLPLTQQSATLETNLFEPSDKTVTTLVNNGDTDGLLKYLAPLQNDSLREANWIVAHVTVPAGVQIDDVKINFDDNDRPVPLYKNGKAVICVSRSSTRSPVHIWAPHCQLFSFDPEQDHDTAVTTRTFDLKKLPDPTLSSSTTSSPTELTAVPITEAEAKQRGIAALVNGKPILWSEVAEPNPIKSLSGDVLKQKLQSIIDRELIIESFMALGGSIPQKYVDERVASFVQDEFGGDRNAFIKKLEAEGSSLKKYQRNIAETVIYVFMKNKNVDEAYDERHPELFGPDDVINTELIEIKKSDASNSSRMFQTALAHEIMDKVKAGSQLTNDGTYKMKSDFYDGYEAYQRVCLADKRTSGLVKFTSVRPQEPVDILPEIWTAISKLKNGQFTDVISASDGNNYIGIVGNRNKVYLPSLNQATLKNIQDAELKLFTEWLDGLRAKAVIQKFDVAPTEI